MSLLNKRLLKFIACGSVDDGKSTLLGHMLCLARVIHLDQLQDLEQGSRNNLSNNNIDYSLLFDGLEAEREQRITIDVAYRYFSTKKRSFIVADAPGHEEYTRNMAVGASSSELAVILVDAAKGIVSQTKRHIRICLLMGIKDFVFAVNKMDLVNFNVESFEKIKRQITVFLKDSKINSIYIIPVSATRGDNIVEKSVNMPWYMGQPLLSYLETVDLVSDDGGTGFCMPIQRVCRPDYTFRGFQGEVITGNISIGDKISVLPSKEKAIVNRIIKDCIDVSMASCGDAITICLDKELDVSRGSVFVYERDLQIGKYLDVFLLWLDNNKLEVGNTYRLQLGTSNVIAIVKSIKNRQDIDTGDVIKANSICENQLALCEIELGIPIVYDVFDKTPLLGEFILVNRTTHATAACGVVRRVADKNKMLLKQSFSVSRQMRESLNLHRAITIWMTGLSGSGKSTISNAVEKMLYEKGVHTIVIDGDNVRMGLCKDLGFSLEDRRENVRRVAEVAKILNDAGLVVIASFVSPIKSDRAMAREIIGDSFIEVFVDAPIKHCIKRGAKGLYRKAIRGEIDDFTGISSPYETPTDAEIVVDTANNSIEHCANSIINYIKYILYAN